jgi:hypothetical protein
VTFVPVMVSGVSGPPAAGLAGRHRRAVWRIVRALILLRRAVLWPVMVMAFHCSWEFGSRLTRLYVV